MKLRIWHKEADPDRTLYVRLQEVEEEEERVVVCLVDEAGDVVEGGNLLILEPGKPVFRCANVLPRHGFPVNEKQRLRIQGLPEEPLEEPTQ